MEKFAGISRGSNSYCRATGKGWFGFGTEVWGMGGLTLHGVAGEGDAAESGDFGVDAGDAGD